MENKAQDLALKVKNAVTNVTPEGTGFIIIYVTPDDDQNYDIISNMSDESAAAFLQDALNGIEEVQPIKLDDNLKIN